MLIAFVLISFPITSGHSGAIQPFHLPLLPAMHSIIFRCITHEWESMSLLTHWLLVNVPNYLIGSTKGLSESVLWAATPVLQMNIPCREHQNHPLSFRLSWGEKSPSQVKTGSGMKWEATPVMISPCFTFYGLLNACAADGTQEAGVELFLKIVNRRHHILQT